MGLPEMRVGSGFDVHPLVAGRELVLGGVHVPYEKGLEGHSDGDALSHAVMDALLGAANLGNKGALFPSNDIRYKDADSLAFLVRVAELLAQGGWRISNVDATILAERPRLAQHFPAMARNIAKALSVDVSRVSVKATTTDKLGFLGRGEGIAAEAVALVVREA